MLSSKTKTSWNILGLTFPHEICLLKVNPHIAEISDNLDKFFGALTLKGVFFYFRVFYKHEKVGLKIKHEVKKEEVQFTCFEFQCQSNTKENVIFLGTKTGRVYQYDFSRESPKLNFVYDSGANFCVTKICVINGELFGDSLLLVSFADGVLKFFSENNRSPISIFSFQNKSIHHIFWDTNINLFYFLNEAEEQDLFGMVIYKEKKNERIKRLVRTNQKITQFDMCTPANFFAVVTQNSTVKVGSITDLRTALLSSKKTSMRLGILMSIEFLDDILHIEFYKNTNFYGKENTASLLKNINKFHGLDLELKNERSAITAFKTEALKEHTGLNVAAVGLEGGGLILLSFS